MIYFCLEVKHIIQVIQIPLIYRHYIRETKETDSDRVTNGDNKPHLIKSYFFKLLKAQILLCDIFALMWTIIVGSLILAWCQCKIRKKLRVK